ncbi:MAG: hypothetical protein HWN81_18975 [Candidatus Lokiarchaeota archaeon]|nr:hypothetical protein [Candidatus Lokiarchaeota archaeon]
MKNEYFNSSKNDISSRRKNQRKKYAVIIISLIAIISLVSIPVVIYAYNIIKNLLNYKQELPCEDLPDIETVRQVVEDYQDIIQEIENTSPEYVYVEVNERCNGKGELYIYYDTVSTREQILEIIGGDTFFGIPYRLFNV